jgi:hypothetical protein
MTSHCSRRRVLTSVPVAALPVVGALYGARSPRDGVGDEQKDGQGLAGKLAPGARVGRWTVTGTAEQAGGLLVALEGARGSFTLEVLKRDDGAADPPGKTRRLGVFVRNGGSGSSPTDEDQGLAAMTLAAHLADVDHLLLPILTTQAERAAHDEIRPAALA